MFSFRQRESGVAVLHQGGQLTYGGFNNLLDDFRQRLRAAHLGTGDRVATLLPNSLALLCAYYACLLEGLIIVPMNTRLSPREISAILRHSGSRQVLVDAVTSQRLAECSGGVTASPMLLADLDEPGNHAPGARLADREWPEDHPAILYYTSGSTGQPKGVLYSHGTLSRNCAMYGSGLAVTAADHAVLSQCMASNFVFTQLTVPFLAAGAIVQVIDFGSEAQTLCAVRGGATFLSLIPWLGYRVIEAAERGNHRDNRLRVAQVGGDSVPPDYFRKFERAFGIFPRQMIGLTETNTYATNPMVPGDLRLESCGLPLPGVILEIRDRRGRTMAAGRTGEIWVRTPAVMAEYWCDPESTRETLIDGWVRTGDAGYLDADGYLWFVGRLKSLIIRDGDNIHPREIELQLIQHPQIRWACVFGTPDPGRGESIMAAVVPLDLGTGIRPSELQHFLEQRLAAVKIPQHWIFLEDFPRTRAGKLDRTALSKSYASYARN